MKQYLITGYDYTDEGALERQMNIRPWHLEGAARITRERQLCFRRSYIG